MKQTTTKITAYIGLVTNQGDAVTTETARAVIERELRNVTAGYNVTQGVGYWLGAPEPCLIVSFLNFEATLQDIGTAFESIRTALDQDAVLLEASLTHAHFVDSSLKPFGAA